MTETVDLYTEEKPQEVTTQEESQTEKGSDQQDEKNVLVTNEIQPVLDELGKEVVPIPLKEFCDHFGIKTEQLKNFEEQVKGVLAASALAGQRGAYLPVIATAPLPPFGLSRAEVVFAAFPVEPYTNIANFKKDPNGRGLHGAGGSAGLDFQQGAFRTGVQITGLATGQERDSKTYYKTNAGFATGKIGLGTPAGNFVSAYVDVGAGYGFSSVVGEAQGKKLDKTYWLPVLTGNIGVDIHVWREVMKIGLSTGFLVGIGPTGDLFEGVKGTGPGGRGLLGIPTDGMLIPIAVTAKLRIGR